MYKSISDGEEASIKHFNQWVDEVKNTVPSEKLLVFEVKEGWGLFRENLTRVSRQNLTRSILSQSRRSVS